VNVHYESKIARWLPEGTAAFTFGEHVYVKGARASQELLLHEAAHVLQFRRYGKLGFLVRYVWYGLTVGYRWNPLEIEARTFANRRIVQCSFLDNVDYLQSL
jgi:Domain of unknown function (DUF4157)